MKVCATPFHSTGPKGGLRHGVVRGVAGAEGPRVSS